VSIESEVSKAWSARLLGCSERPSPQGRVTMRRRRGPAFAKLTHEMQERWRINTVFGLASLVILIAAPAMSQDRERGQELAQSLCANCHFSSRRGGTNRAYWGANLHSHRQPRGPNTGWRRSVAAFGAKCHARPSTHARRDLGPGGIHHVAENEPMTLLAVSAAMHLLGASRSGRFRQSSRLCYLSFRLHRFPFAAGHGGRNSSQARLRECPLRYTTPWRAPLRTKMLQALVRSPTHIV
jgi:hypothetical protein